jgi:hypothetical protein
MQLRAAQGIASFARWAAALAFLARNDFIVNLGLADRDKA